MVGKETERERANDLASLDRGLVAGTVQVAWQSVVLGALGTKLDIRDIVRPRRSTTSAAPRGSKE